MATKKILIPYNFTNPDQKAADFVIHTFSHVEDIEITLFHAYIPLPPIEAMRSTVMQKIESNLSYLQQKINEQEEELISVREKLVESGFSEEQVNYVFDPKEKDIASHIIDLAREKKYDTIVLNRRSGRMTRFFTISTYVKVAGSLSDVVVCLLT